MLRLQVVSRKDKRKQKANIGIRTLIGDWSSRRISAGFRGAFIEAFFSEGTAVHDRSCSRVCSPATKNNIERVAATIRVKTGQYQRVNLGYSLRYTKHRGLERPYINTRSLKHQQPYITTGRRFLTYAQILEYLPNHCAIPEIHCEYEEMYSKKRKHGSGDATKYYAVKAGHTVGVFTTWPECQKSITGYSGSVRKYFL